MLVTLSIKNFVLIESLTLDFTSGLYVISGETGAGKSVLLNSIVFALGGKFDSKVIRSGADFASVSAQFSVSKEIEKSLEDFGIDASESLIIKRQQFANGRKKFFINDDPATAKIVTQISDSLIEMHGQHGYGRLLNPSCHLGILDIFGELEDSKQDVKVKYREYKNIEDDLEMISKDQGLIRREIDYLEHVVSELESKCPGRGEEEDLASKRIKLRNNEKRNSALEKIENIIQETSLDNKLYEMQKLSSGIDESFHELLQNLEQMQIYLGEAKSSINALKNDSVEENLDDIESRLFEIKDLSRKYNVPSDELSEFLEKTKGELDSLKNKINNSDNLAENLAKARAEYQKHAKDLSDERKKVAKLFESKIEKEFAPLSMEGCKWIVRIEEKAPSANGIDDVRFTAITNPGSSPAPIDKIASGGEIARMMLAVKLALFDKDSSPTIIFDEIDTGLGGRVADSVGERIKALSKIAQTIIITHQPQVASKADYNILVSKKNGISFAKILDENEKQEEIARMISGAEVTDTAKKAAKELIKQ